jgi:prophage antirepressor-like protein
MGIFKNMADDMDSKAMGNVIRNFTSGDFGTVRVVEYKNEPWFVGRDVAEILKYKEPQKAVIRHTDIEDRTKYPILSEGGMQETWLINESGLYSLIISSNMPGANKFKRWVTKEVLPAIRKTGSYGAITDESFIDHYIAYADEKTKNLFRGVLQVVKDLNAQIEENAPKVKLANTILEVQAQNSIKEVKELAVRAQKLNQVKPINFLSGNSDKNRIEIVEDIIHSKDGSIKMTKTTKIITDGLVTELGVVDNA